MRLEIRNPKRIEETHSLFPNFQFIFMSNTEYMFQSIWKNEYWRITLNRLTDNRRGWGVEVRLVSYGKCETFKVTTNILSNINFFKAFITQKMDEIWKAYLNSVI